jgi:DNA-binding GntR family transcriptional regulator
MEYERVYFSTPERRARSAAQHGEIVDALAAGDQERAAALVRDNFTTALPELTAELDARNPG